MIKAIVTLLLLTSCTISMQNISTHGSATDLVDQAQETKPSAVINANTIPAF